MNILLIILSFILFCDIYGLDTVETTNIDILAILKEKHPSCDLHDFVKSTDDPEGEYNALVNDLKKYCSTSTLTNQYQIICHIILIELEIGCSLPIRHRLIPIKYTTLYTSTQICSMNKVSSTNSWIWKKLSSNERIQIGSVPIDLCPKLTSYNETLLLTSFFYKIARRIKRFDTLNLTNISDKISTNLTIDDIQLLQETKHEKSNNTNDNKIVQDNQLITNKTNENSKLLKDNIENINKTNTTQIILDTKQNQTELDVNITKSIRKSRKKLFLHRKKPRPKDDTNGNILNPADGKEQLNDEEIEDNDKELQQAAPDLNEGKINDNGQLDAQVINKTNNNDGIPLGRAGEKPEREQVNERPKPQAVDVDVVFKRDDGKERNWIEGKKGVKEQETGLGADLNHLHQIKHEENPIIISQIARKRPSLRSRIRYIDEQADISNSFITSFLLFILLIIIVYLILNNRNKILGLIIEGCRRRQKLHGRGGNTHLKRHTRLSQST